MTQVIYNKEKITTNFFNNLKEISRLSRLDIIRMLTLSHCSHVGSALSVIDILTVLYNCCVDTQLIKNKSPLRDYIILSKGHAAPALYAALAHANIISHDILNSYFKNGGVLSGHPIKDSLPGIEASTGSLGHGLPLGVGLALAAKNDKRPNKIYVVMGDGECQEGSVWEALMLASRYSLNNIIIIVDHNNLQGFGRSSNMVTGTLEEKFSAFGCNTVSINGHNYKELLDSLMYYKLQEKPYAIIAHTIKGHGISFIQDKLEWHYKSFNQEEYQIARKELGEL
jgi:transketolase